MKKIVLALIAGLMFLTGCGVNVQRDYSCGTNVVPPVAVDPIVCHNGYPGVRWYGAPLGTLQPQYGLPMDQSWWYGGTGTIGYGRGYDPRPASYWQNQPRYAPFAQPTVQVPAQPPNAQTVVVNVKNTVPQASAPSKGSQPKTVSKASADPPKVTAPKAGAPAKAPAPRTSK